MKNTAVTFQEMKANGEKISMLTCYDYSTAKLMEAAGINAVLVDMTGWRQDKLLSFDDVKLEVEEAALIEIAKKAIAQKTGARGLRAIMEGILMEPMFNLPTHGNIGKVTITKECVTGQEPPMLTDRRNKVVAGW